MLIIGADYRTTSKSEFDPSRQCLVGITINAPFAEQNHRECPCVSTHTEKPWTDQLDMTTTVVAQKTRKGVSRGASLHRKTPPVAARK
jgi:hypothetical protein